MKIELSTSEVWDLLKEGSTNQRNFVDSLRYDEFEEFLDILEIEFPEIDLRGNINGGVLSVEEDPVEEYVIWENNRKSIVLVWYYTYY